MIDKIKTSTAPGRMPLTNLITNVNSLCRICSTKRVTHQMIGNGFEYLSCYKCLQTALNLLSMMGLESLFKELSYRKLTKEEINKL